MSCLFFFLPGFLVMGFQDRLKNPHYSQSDLHHTFGRIIVLEVKVAILPITQYFFVSCQKSTWQLFPVKSNHC